MEQKGEPPKKNIIRPGTIILVIVVIVGFVLLQQYAVNNLHTEKLSYTKFLEKVEKGDIKKVTFNGTEIKGEYAKPRVGKFKTTMPFEDKDLPKFLSRYNVEIESEPSSDMSVGFILLNIVPYAILLFFIIWMMRQAASSGGQAFSFGRSKAKQVTGE
ncbi:MAG: ATP-dependent metallopeptidase FtsH/Yme1/Tma family protein, partial [Candidatus Eremiobacteraeota bacterium]|nr:ATP-dependent metallopeptidase FtsH/Yme1/Tma family protein [Candidatus Eremiobacteraeota bacterium]